MPKLKMTSEESAILSYNIWQLRQKFFPGQDGARVCAKKMGVSYHQWLPWENGGRTPDYRSQKKIAEHFGVSLEDLLGKPAEWDRVKSNWAHEHSTNHPYLILSQFLACDGHPFTLSLNNLLLNLMAHLLKAKEAVTNNRLAQRELDREVRYLLKEAAYRLGHLNGTFAELNSKKTAVPGEIVEAASLAEAEDNLLLDKTEDAGAMADGDEWLKAPGELSTE
ncbi:MAG: helix-turn-helix domain-containing protein [Planctomycetota bacterium]|nr:helix-turn-helix domain-containing protein [Planctomycetota bacterium]